jgi:hypothetical protein
MRHLIWLRTRHWVIGLIVLAILVAWWVAMRAAETDYQWSQVDDLGPTMPLSAPSLLSPPLAVIRQTSVPGAPLIYQPLNTGRSVPILSYPDVNPRQWQAAFARDDAYHVVWLEPDNRLRSALIAAHGETQRGPIMLAADVQPDFVTLTLADGRLLVVWIAARTGDLNALVIDAAGRPGPVSTPILGGVVRIAAALDHAERVHLAWLTAPAPAQWEMRYQVSGVYPVAIDTPITLHTFRLAPGESLTSFRMGLDNTHGYLFWGTTTAEQPDIERLQMLSFPLDASADVRVLDLVLPKDFQPSEQTLAYGHVGRIALPESKPGHAAALRWPRPASGQSAVFPLALAVRTSDGWRPGIVYFRQGEMLGHQIVAPWPADAGPPALWADPSGNLYLVWAGLRNTSPHLYVASTNGRGLIPID